MRAIRPVAPENASEPSETDLLATVGTPRYDDQALKVHEIAISYHNAVQSGLIATTNVHCSNRLRLECPQSSHSRGPEGRRSESATCPLLR